MSTSKHTPHFPKATLLYNNPKTLKILSYSRKHKVYGQGGSGFSSIEHPGPIVGVRKDESHDYRVEVLIHEFTHIAETELLQNNIISEPPSEIYVEELSCRLFHYLKHAGMLVDVEQ